VTETTRTTPEQAAAAFRRIAETARSEHAPLYEHVAAGVAADPDLLELSTHARPGQSLVYLLFDAVQYLLLGGARHELARYYPSITETPLDAADVFPVFRAFCLENAETIKTLVANHNNQTNEVGRLAALLPALSEAARRGGGKPLGIVEVGPAAGLNLCFDRYYFDYGRVQWGDDASPVRIVCQLEAAATPPLSPGLPAVAYRVGLDVEPIDLSDDDAARWMLSSTWPDHRDLQLMQRRAIDLLRRDPPRLVLGDALAVGPLLDAVPADLTLCVYQSFMISHLSEAEREQFLAILAAESRRRPVYFVSMTGAGIGGGSRRGRVDLLSWVEGRHESVQLVEGHSHGRSLRWLG